MVGSLTRQSELFFTPLAQEITRLRDDLLDALDPVLDDGELIALVRQRLATRHPRSHCTGRVGIAPDRLLRCCWTARGGSVNWRRRRRAWGCRIFGATTCAVRRPAGWRRRACLGW